MKRMLIYVLALLVMLNALPAFAETVAPEGTEPAADIQYDYDELVVGTITPFNGSFYSGMWGNIASDLDVRALIHGYKLVTWGEDDRFEVDPSVVSGFAVKENAQGDRLSDFFKRQGRNPSGFGHQPYFVRRFDSDHLCLPESIQYGVDLCGRFFDGPISVDLLQNALTGIKVGQR